MSVGNKTKIPQHRDKTTKHITTRREEMKGTSITGDRRCSCHARSSVPFPRNIYPSVNGTQREHIAEHLNHISTTTRKLGVVPNVANRLCITTRTQFGAMNYAVRNEQRQRATGNGVEASCERRRRGNATHADRTHAAARHSGSTQF